MHVCVTDHHMRNGITKREEGPEGRRRGGKGRQWESRDMKAEGRVSVGRKEGNQQK